MPKNELTEDERARLFSDFHGMWPEETIRQIIEEALNHRASTKVKSLYLYCRSWLRREQNHLSRLTADGPAPNRVDYSSWETPRRKEGDGL